MRLRRAALLLLGALLGASGASAAALPRPAHVVVVIEENHTLAQIIGSAEAPYINGLARQGALFTHAHGVMHPSLPNYFALFAGETNTNGDACSIEGFSSHAPNLATALAAAHLSFTGYAEALPEPGYEGCWGGTYAKKHTPWAYFTNVPQRTESLPFSALRPYDRLPTVAFIVPDVNDDMHDGTVAQGDAWLARNLAPLLAWGATHDTLVILTWDEGYDNANSIPILFAGPMVRPGRYAEPVTHLTLLRTIEEMYALPRLGRSASVRPILDCWR